MIKPTIFTWIIAISGVITFLPLMVSQLILLLRPNSQQAKKLIIGNGAD